MVHLTTCVWSHIRVMVTSNVPQPRVSERSVLLTRNATRTTLSSAVVIVTKVNARFVLRNNEQKKSMVVDRTLVLQELSREGYSCQGGKRCLASLSCVNGVCQKAGLVVGEDCTNASCRVPLVCDMKSSRCVERPKSGENCSETLPCGLGLDCVEGMCVEQFSRDVGEKCGDRTCMLPLVCGTSTHKCIRASSPDTITQRRCTDTDDCPDDCECLCDWRTGTRHCSIKEAPSSNAIVLYNEFVTLSTTTLCFTSICLIL